MLYTSCVCYRLCLLATLSLLSLLNRGIKSERPSSEGENNLVVKKPLEGRLTASLRNPCAIISCYQFIYNTGEHRLISPGTVSTQKMCRNRNLQKSQKFVDYPLKMKNPTEFLQSFCTRDPKKSEIFDRFGPVLFTAD